MEKYLRSEEHLFIYLSIHPSNIFESLIGDRDSPEQYWRSGYKTDKGFDLLEGAV